MNKTHGTRGSSPGKQGGAEQDPADVAHANDSAGTAPRDLWSAVLADLQEQMVPANFTRWLARTSLLSQAAGTAVVGVPDLGIEAAAPVRRIAAAAEAATLTGSRRGN